MIPSYESEEIQIQGQFQGLMESMVNDIKEFATQLKELELTADYSLYETAQTIADTRALDLSSQTEYQAPYNDENQLKAKVEEMKNLFAPQKPSKPRAPSVKTENSGICLKEEPCFQFLHSSD